MKRLLAILRGRGVRSVLCEGGPTLNAELLRAGGVDELFHCMAPKLAGEPDAPTMVTGVLHETAGMGLVALLENESHLFMRYRLSRV
jgi:5-amino-6-(5-phosphoribosylamino)uracil reductase